MPNPIVKPVKIKLGSHVLAILLVTTACLISFSAVGQPPRRKPVVSPQINEDRTVVFRLNAPQATKVMLGGTWNWKKEWSHEMVKGDSGVWELKVGPLDADMYEYAFTVDGVRSLDPSNPIVTRDGPINENGIIVP